MKKTLTIVVPTYNMEKYLDKCLTSLIIKDIELMNQLEVIVIIDGATDKSSYIAHGYEKKYKDTFRVIDKKNGNYGSCINRGLKEATGKYIKILDADDWYDTTVLEECLSFLQKRDEDIVITSYNVVEAEHHAFWTWKMDCLPGIVFDITAINPIRMAMHAVMHKTENLRKIRYHQTEGISYTDTEWFYLPFAYAKTFVYFDKPLYHYLVGREGQTVEGITVAKKIYQPIKIAKKMIDEYYEVDVDDCHKKYLAGCVERILEYIYRVVLIVGNGKYNLILLKEFDEYLKATPFYDSVDKYNYRDFNINYITEWRQNGYKWAYVMFKIYFYNLRNIVHNKLFKMGCSIML